MRNTKKFLAVALAATMALGSGVVAFADESVTSKSSTGTGSNEGNLNTHVIDVELPTVPTGSTPFAYTMDLERLIQQTNHAKYATATFPATNSDTGVYFATAGEAGAESYDEVTSPDVADIGTYYEKTTTNTDEYTKTEDTAVNAEKTYYVYDDDDGYVEVNGPTDGNIGSYFEKSTKSADSYALTSDTSLNGSKTYYTKTAGTASVAYANTSEELTVTSRSSADVKLTVQVAASNATTDVPLVDAAPAEDETEAKLYLALKVGDTTTAIKAGETVSKEVTIPGKDSNFEASVVDGEYAYTVIDDPAEWGKASFSVTGAASTASAEGLTAPTLTVTWKYEDPAAALAVTEASISSGATPVASGSADATAGITHTAALVRGTDTTIALLLPTDVSIQHVYVAGSTNGLSSNTENAARAEISGNNVVVKGDSDWATAGSGTKYVKIVVGTSSETTETFVVKVNISAS